MAESVAGEKTAAAVSDACLCASGWRDAMVEGDGTETVASRDMEGALLEFGTACAAWDAGCVS